jgi:uracil DNA glycosylase
MFGNDWDSVLSDVVSEKWFIDMIDSVRKEYNSKTIFL